MPPVQTRIHPTDLKVQGNAESGEVWLHYKTGPDATTSIQLSPKLLGETIVNLLLCASQSKQAEMREVTQYIAARELHAKVLPGPLLCLVQELECGLSITRTLDNADAERLHAELDSGLALVKQSGSSVSH